MGRLFVGTSGWVYKAGPVRFIPQRVTTDFVYIRFHGLHGGSAHDYTDLELKPWAAFCRKCLKRGLDVYA